MNHEFENYLGEKYLFMNKESLLKLCPESTYGKYGLEIDKGWYPVLEKACQRISEVMEKYSIPQESFIVLQCKQKFGALKFYWRLSADSFSGNVDFPDKGSVDFKDYTSQLRNDIDLIIKGACEEALITCEFCGKSDKSVELRQYRWIYTHCDDCHQKRVQKIEERIKNK